MSCCPLSGADSTVLTPLATDKLPSLFSVVCNDIDICLTKLSVATAVKPIVCV